MDALVSVRQSRSSLLSILGACFTISPWSSGDGINCLWQGAYTTDDGGIVELAKTPWPDWFWNRGIILVIEVLNEVQILRVERQNTSIRIFQLADHPGQSDVGNSSIGPRATDVRMSAWKPALLKLIELMWVIGLFP
jgi:hypothetical protein